MRNLTASFFYFVSRVTAAILQLKFIARLFGSQYAGLNALLNQLAFYVAMIELGLAAAAISLLYEPIKSNDIEAVSGLLHALYRDTRRLMFAALPVIAALVYGYARSLHSTLPHSVVVATLSLTALSGLVSLLSIHYQAYLNASEQMFKIHLVLGCGHLAKTAVGVGLAAILHNYLWLPGVIVGVSACEVLALRWRFHRSFPHFVASATRHFFSLVRQRAKYVLFHRIGSLIYYQSDFIILSLTATLVLVKDYAEVQYLVSGVLSLFTAVFSAMTASIARRQLGVSRAIRWKQYRAAAQATYFLSFAVCVTFYFAAPDVVRIVFGGSAPVGRTMLLFAALLLLNLIRSVDDAYVTATGAFHVGFYLPVMEGPLYIALGVILSRRIGMNGVLWAGIITNLIFVVIAKTVVVAYGVLSEPVARLVGLRAWNAIFSIVLVTPLYFFVCYTSTLGLSPAVHCLTVCVPSLVYMGAIAFFVIRHGFHQGAEEIPASVDTSRNVA